MSCVKYLYRFVNKNPRNMERMRLQRKPNGWEFEKNASHNNFVYRVDFHSGKNATTANVVHYEDGVVIEASTSEKTVKAQLHSSIDVSAAYNIGRLLALRCYMAGIKHLTLGIDQSEVNESKRRASFLKALQENGIKLDEPECIAHTHLNDPKLTWEPFEYKHTREDKLDELDLSLELGKGVR